MNVRKKPLKVLGILLVCIMLISCFSTLAASAATIASAPIESEIVSASVEAEDYDSTIYVGQTKVWGERTRYHTVSFNSYSSSNPNVLTINDTGTGTNYASLEIKALSPGYATLTMSVTSQQQAPPVVGPDFNLVPGGVYMAAEEFSITYKVIAADEENNTNTDNPDGNSSSGADTNTNNGNNSATDTNVDGNSTGTNNTVNSTSTNDSVTIPSQNDTTTGKTVSNAVTSNGTIATGDSSYIFALAAVLLVVSGTVLVKKRKRFNK